jgi:hypothetical protein
MRKTVSQATAKRVVINEYNVADMTGATLGEDQGALMTREARNRATNDSEILDLNDALTAASSDAKPLMGCPG